MERTPICTYEGLHEWTSKMFERLGWMVLARHHTESILCYQKGLKHLHSQIQRKIKETIDHDRKHDLEELMTQVETLYQFTLEHLIPPSKGSSKQKKVKTKSFGTVC